MKTRINILTTLGIAVMTLMLTATSCRDDGPVPTIYLNENFKEFIYFKEGTWWVYQHTTDSTRDSVVVVSSEIKEEPHFSNPSFDDKLERYVERFYYDTYSYTSGNLYKYDAGSACYSPQLTEEELKNRDRPCYRAKIKVGGALSQVFFYYPVIGYEASPMGHSTITLAEHYDSLKVGDLFYHDVYRIHETKNPVEGIRETNLYVARGYGIIRKEINDKERDRDPDNWQYWDLVESNIIQ